MINGGFEIAENMTIIIDFSNFTTFNCLFNHSPWSIWSRNLDCSFWEDVEICHFKYRMDQVKWIKLPFTPPPIDQKQLLDISLRISWECLKLSEFLYRFFFQIQYFQQIIHLPFPIISSQKFPEWNIPKDAEKLS